MSASAAGIGKWPQCVALTLLAVGAVINVTAGLRRPLRERALLRQGYYAAAQEAVRAVQERFPGESPVNLVLYDGDYVDGMDGAGWARSYLLWQLFPRVLPEYRVDARGQVRPRTATGPLRGPTLFFRAGGRPVLPAGQGDEAARADSWTLTYVPAEQAPR